MKQPIQRGENVFTIKMQLLKRKIHQTNEYFGTPGMQQLYRQIGSNGFGCLA